MKEKPTVRDITHLDQAGGAFLSWQGEVEVQMGGRCRLAGRSFCLLPLTVTIAVLVCGALRTCSERGSSLCLWQKSTL